MEEKLTAKPKEKLLRSDEFLHLPLVTDGTVMADKLGSLTDFDGNKAAAAIILAKIVSGMDVTTERLDLNSLNEPLFAIYFGKEEVRPVQLILDETANLIFIDKLFLAQLSKLVFGKVGLYEMGGESFFRGTLEELALVIGMEEMHHHIHSQSYGDQGSDSINNPPLWNADYKATDEGEYEALKFICEVVVEKRFSPESVGFLTNLLDSAKAIRKSKGLAV